jgi:hypothetical protein
LQKNALTISIVKNLAQSLTIVVGQSKIFDQKTKCERVCKYSDVPTDKEKWVHNLTYMPIPYDLMFLKIEDSFRTKSGWWNGETWKGHRVKARDKIIAWKRNYELP